MFAVVAGVLALALIGACVGPVVLGVVNGQRWLRGLETANAVTIDGQFFDRTTRERVKINQRFDAPEALAIIRRDLGQAQYRVDWLSSIMPAVCACADRGEVTAHHTDVAEPMHFHAHGFVTRPFARFESRELPFVRALQALTAAGYVVTENGDNPQP